VRSSLPVSIVLLASALAFAAAPTLIAQDAEPQDVSDEELDLALEKWAGEYVRYIISDGELAEWRNLSSRADRMLFIETFWGRRDPTPESPENEYRQEYLERWGYVQQHFTAGKPGWRTDRGRIYLMLGPPSTVERHPFGRDRTERPSEVWYYNSVNNRALPATVEIAFVDFMGYGDYEIVTDLDRTARFHSAFGIAMNNLDAYALRRPGEVRPDDYLVSTMFEESRIRHPELLSRDLFELERELGEIAETPTLNLPPLREVIRTEIVRGELSFGLAVSAFQARGGNAYLPVTVSVPLRNVSFSEAGGVRRYLIDLYARIHGDVASDIYEETLDINLPAEEVEDLQDQAYLYQFWFSVPPGSYRLSVTLRDSVANNIGHMQLEAEAPSFTGGGLALSDIVLADSVSEIPENQIAGSAQARPFQLGNRRVIPNVVGEIARGRESFWLYFHVYNFAGNPDSGGARLKVEYFIYHNGDLYSRTPPSYVVQEFGNRTAVQSAFPVDALEIGSYRIVVAITDEVAEETARGECRFRVVPPRNPATQ